MPHIVEAYAKNAGVKVGKPYLPLDFYPLPDDSKKAILVQNSSGQTAKNYRHIQDLVQILLSSEKFREEYYFCQIGLKSDKKLFGTSDLRGKTTLPQVFYLIKSCYGVIANDSYCIHAAGIFDKKILAFYGNNFANRVGPYWGDKDNHVLLEGHGGKPSFAAEEKDPQVDSIEISKAVEACNKLFGLDIDFKFTKDWVGKFYYKNNPHTVKDCDTFFTHVNKLLERVPNLSELYSKCQSVEGYENFKGDMESLKKKIGVSLVNPDINFLKVLRTGANDLKVRLARLVISKLPSDNVLLAIESLVNDDMTRIIVVCSKAVKDELRRRHIDLNLTFEFITETSPVIKKGSMIMSSLVLFNSNNSANLTDKNLADPDFLTLYHVFLMSLSATE